MGKALVEVGAVIAGVALIATGVGAAAGAGLLGAEAAGMTAALGASSTLTLFGVSTSTLLEVGAATAFVGELMIKPKLTGAGSAQQFKADTNAPIPCIAGRFGTGGNIVYETTSGGSNKAKAGAAGNEYLTFCTVLSGLGPIKGVETLKFNDTVLNFGGQDCSGGYIPSDVIGAYKVPYKNNNNGTYENDQFKDHAWQNLQLGAVPTPYFAPPDKLASDNATLTEWDGGHGLSGFAASFLTLVYDQTVYTGGVPAPLWTLSGYSVYDPRQDATYPGGAGPQRWAGQGASAAALLAARATWGWSANPYIHALNYALGFFLPDGSSQLGALYAGGGTPWRGVDVDQFIACANIADANGWTIGMQWTTDDDPWSVLTTMLQAGGGQPIDRDGRISCIINAPLTSLGTVTADQLQGSVSVDATTALRDKLNRVYPRFHSEPHNWAMVPVVEPITEASYLAEDGRVIAKQLDYEGVTQVNQACQLAAYDLANSREGIVATLPCKPAAANYRVGDCITVDVDQAGLTNLKMVVIKRSPDFSTGAVTLTCRSETDAKHAFAMGLSGSAPPTPTITGVDPSYVGAPLPGFWATGILELTDPQSGEARSILSVLGSSSDNVYAETAVLRWRPVAQVNGEWTPTGDGSWTYRSFPASQGNFQLDLNPGAYDVQIAYQLVGGAYPSDDGDWLDLGVETVGGSTASNTANVGGYTAPEIEAAVAAIDQALDNTSGLQDEIDAAETSIGDVQDALTTLSGQVTDGQGQLTDAVNAAQADADTVALTALADSAAQFQRNQSLKAATTMPSGQKVTFALSDEVTFRQEGDAATATQITGLGVTVGDQAASIGDLQTVTVDLQAEKADASDLQELQTTYDGFTASVSTFEGATSTELGDQASRLTTLEADYGGVTASVSAEATARSDADEALTATQETQAGEISGNASSISTLQDTVTSGDSAQTQLNEQLQSSIGDLQDASGAQGGDISDLRATASEQAGTLAELAGKLLAYFDFTAAADGNAAQVRIAADNNTSAIQLIAQVLSIASDQGGGTPIPVLVATAGVVQIMTKLLIGSSLLLDPVSKTIYADLGSIAIALFGPFGANSDLVFWVGPGGTALSAMTRANADMYFGTDRSAYFGGSLSAGALTTKAATSDTSASAQAETAVFGSNGGTITVTLSYSYSSTFTASYAVGQTSAYQTAKGQIPNTQASNDGSGGFTASGSDPGGWSVALYRSVNGGAFQQVATLTGLGSWNDDGDPPTSGDPGYISYRDSAGGSLTYTDPQQVAQNRQYQAVLTSRNPEQTYAVAQTLSIICVEEPS